MIKKVYQLGIIMSALSMSITFAENSIVLTPERMLTIEMVNDVALHNAAVEINDAARQNIKLGYDVVLQAALNNKAVYGLTVGVGWNKDQPVFQEVQGKRILSPELIDLSKKFNVSSLRAHASGVGEPIPVDIVRAAMLIRLNTFLNGEAGVSPEVAKYYIEFLNKGITPVIPSIGTVGEADITLSAHIGLAMIGEWDVFYKGQRQSASKVFKETGLKPLEPIGKDFLSILSNNALMAAEAIDVLNSAEKLYDTEIKIFVLSMEGLNGNVAPFSNAAIAARPYPSVVESAQDIREAAKGSDLWVIKDNRSLQDPLSYRSMAYSLGEIRSALAYLKENLLIQINHSDDNPVVLIHGLPQADDSQQMAQYLVGDLESGAIVPTSNFNFLVVTRSVSQLNEALAKLSEVITQQILRLENPEITKLSRFLAADDNHGHAFGAIQKPFVAVNQQIKQLAQPQWFATATLAGNIEDTASMSGLTIMNAQEIIHNLYYVMAYQLLHAAQAVELRQDFKQGDVTKALLENYRQTTQFIDQDTATTPIIEKTLEFLQQ